MHILQLASWRHWSSELYGKWSLWPRTRTVMAQVLWCVLCLSLPWVPVRAAPEPVEQPTEAPLKEEIPCKLFQTAPTCPTASEANNWEWTVKRVGVRSSEVQRRSPCTVEGTYRYLPHIKLPGTKNTFVFLWAVHHHSVFNCSACEFVMGRH